MQDNYRQKRHHQHFKSQQRRYTAGFDMLLGIEKAQALVEEYTDTAIRALDAFDGDSTYLADYARRLAGRMH